MRALRKATQRENRSVTGMVREKRETNNTSTLEGRISFKEHFRKEKRVKGLLRAASIR